MNELLVSALISMQTPETYVMRPVDPNYEAQAARWLGKAVAKEYRLGDYAKRLEKRYVHKDVKKYGAYVAIPCKIIIDRRIVFRWEF